MEELEPVIRDEYIRVLEKIDDEPELQGQLTSRDVLKAHFLIANHFYLEGEGLGGVGPKDIGLLKSAVSRQSVSLGGKRKWDSDFDVCSTLFYGLIKNHPFHDANKRTALLCCLWFLYQKGYCPKINEKDVEDFTVEIADDKLYKYARFNELKKTDPDPEVRYISYFLRKNSRGIDRRRYAVTFRELQKILNRYGFSLENPNGNFIDVVKTENVRSFFGLGNTREKRTTLGQIGFPRWTVQVSDAAMKTVRDVTRLNPKDGVDSATFFHGVDQLQSLLTTYSEPLMRLAYR
jgi:death-on-curing family protein